MPPHPTARRDPAHVLYGHAGDLLAAAQALRAATAGGGAAGATAATVGCLEATLNALADSVDGLCGRAIDHLEDPAWAQLCDQPRAAPPARTARQFDDLARALRTTRDMAGGIRCRARSTGTP